MKKQVDVEYQYCQCHDCKHRPDCVKEIDDLQAENDELRRDFEYITAGRAMLKDMTGPNGEMIGYVVVDLDTGDFLGASTTKHDAISDAIERDAAMEAEKNEST